MKPSPPRHETMMAHVEQRFGRAALLASLAREHPAELVTEILRAALGHGVVTAAEALDMVREGQLDLATTLNLLARKGEREGWDPEVIVLEALQGQPH